VPQPPRFDREPREDRARSARRLAAVIAGLVVSFVVQSRSVATVAGDRPFLSSAAGPAIAAEDPALGGTTRLQPRRRDVLCRRADGPLL